MSIRYLDSAKYTYFNIVYTLIASLVLLSSKFLNKTCTQTFLFKNLEDNRRRYLNTLATVNFWLINIFFILIKNKKNS